MSVEGILDRIAEEILTSLASAELVPVEHAGKLFPDRLFRNALRAIAIRPVGLRRPGSLAMSHEEIRIRF